MRRKKSKKSSSLEHQLSLGLVGEVVFAPLVEELKDAAHLGSRHRRQRSAAGVGDAIEHAVVEAETALSDLVRALHRAQVALRISVGHRESAITIRVVAGRQMVLGKLAKLGVGRIAHGLYTGAV